MVFGTAHKLCLCELLSAGALLGNKIYLSFIVVGLFLKGSFSRWGK